MVHKESDRTVQSYTEYTRGRSRCPRCRTHLPTAGGDGLCPDCQLSVRSQ